MKQADRAGCQTASSHLQVGSGRPVRLFGVCVVFLTPMPVYGICQECK